MNPKMIIFGLLGLALVSFGMYGLKTYNQMKADEKARIQAIITLTENVAKEASRADNQETRANIAEATNANLRESLVASQAAQKKINTEFTEFRTTANSQIAVLQKHDLQALLDAKPELVVKKVNQATASRFQQVEELLDGN